MSSPSPLRSRPRQHASDVHAPYFPIGVAHLDGQVDEAAPEPLHKLVRYPRSPVEELPNSDPVTYEAGGLEVDSIALEVQRLERIARPWWRRPSPTW